MGLLVVEASYRAVPVELRERLALDLGETGALAARTAERHGEAVVISTCNRVCCCVAAAEAERARAELVDELARRCGEPANALARLLGTWENEEAARHVLRVACGLDSLVPGEAQILGQVRAAYEAADRAGAVGPTLHQLFRQALHAGKRVRNETEIGQSPASVSSAAAELAARVFGDLRRCRALVVGAGKMADLALANLAARGVSSLVVVNRSQEAARALAGRYGGEAARLEQLPAELARADIVVSSTGASGLVLHASEVAVAMRARRGRPMFLIDIAVPRDLDPRINELDGCYLYDIDDLRQVVEDSLAARREQAAAAERIVEEELAAFCAWQRSRHVVPEIVQLRRKAEQIRAAELARLSARLGGLDEGQRRTVESLTAQIVNKLLHAPTVRLKEAAATPSGALYARTLRELFGLDDAER